GIEVVLDVRKGIRNMDGRWGVARYGERSPELPGFTAHKMFLLGQIPYRNIVDYDLLGDEYHGQPHLFCLFADGGRPYEHLRYASVDDPYGVELEPEDQVDVNTGERWDTPTNYG